MCDDRLEISIALFKARAKGKLAIVVVAIVGMLIGSVLLEAGLSRCPVIVGPRETGPSLIWVETGPGLICVGTNSLASARRTRRVFIPAR